MCSSRSRATPPAASSTHTNISDTLTATTTANVFSGVRRPWISVLWIWIGWPIVDSTFFERLRLRSANSANASIRSSCAAFGAGGQTRDHAVQLGRDLMQADQVRRRAEHTEVAAAEQQPDRLRGGALDLFGEPQVRLRERGIQLGLDERLLQRVAVVQDFDAALAHAGGDAGGDVARDHHGGHHVAGGDVGDRLLARGDGDGGDLAEQLFGVPADGDVFVADGDRLPGGRFVDDRHARLARSA